MRTPVPQIAGSSALVLAIGIGAALAMGPHPRAPQDTDVLAGTAADLPLPTPLEPGAGAGASDPNLPASSGIVTTEPPATPTSGPELPEPVGDLPSPALPSPTLPRPTPTIALPLPTAPTPTPTLPPLPTPTVTVTRPSVPTVPPKPPVPTTVPPLLPIVPDIPCLSPVIRAVDEQRMPLAGITVLKALSGAGPYSPIGKTDASGRFVLEEPGQQVGLWVQGQLNILPPGTASYRFTLSPQAAVGAPLCAGGPDGLPAPVDVVMRRGATVTGRILPLPGVTVTAVHAYYVSTSVGAPGTGFAVQGADTYRVPGLEPGHQVWLRVQCTSADGMNGDQRLQSVFLGLAGSTTTADLTVTCGL